MTDQQFLVIVGTLWITSGIQSSKDRKAGQILGILILVVACLK